MRKLGLVIISIIIGVFIIIDINNAVESALHLSKTGSIPDLGTIFVECIKSLILMLFMTTLWIVNASCWLANIGEYLEKQPHLLGPSS